MARNGSGVYSLPAGSIVSDGDLGQASQHNTPLQDLETDMNTARPVVAGGTGATTADDALTNLGMPIKCIAAAYVDGGAGTLTGSTGIASITKNGTGDYSFTFTNTQADAVTLFCGIPHLGVDGVLSVLNVSTTGFDVKSYVGGTLTNTFFSIFAWRIH